MATISPDILLKTLKRHLPPERHFYTGMALAMLMVAIVGFLPSILQPSGRRAPISPFIAVHGMLFFGWLLIFLIQSRLIATRRTAVHRQLGIAAGFVLAFMVPAGFAATIAMVRRGFDLSGDLTRTTPDLLFESVFQFGDLLLFTTLAVAGICFRRRPDVHKRLMLFANVSLMPAPLAHLAGHIPRLLPHAVAVIQIPLAVFLIATLARDFWLAKKLRPLTATLAAVIFLSGPLWAILVGPSLAWHRAVAWLVR